MRSGDSLEDVSTAQGKDYDAVKQAIHDAVKTRLDAAVADGLDQAASEEGRRAAVTTIHARSATWYDPEMVSVALALCANGLLLEVAAHDIEALVRDLEPSWLVRLADADEADRIMSAVSVTDEG